MKIQKVNQMNFGKKVHSLNTAQMYSMKILLTRMNNETIVKDNGRTFSTTIIKEISGKKNRFIDTRMIFEKVADNKQMTGKTLFIMDKTQLVIDNSTGNIIDWKKPFLKCWGKVMKDFNKNLNFFRENYYNNFIIKKKPFTLEGYTQKGFDMLMAPEGKKNA